MTKILRVFDLAVSFVERLIDKDADNNNSIVKEAIAFLAVASIVIWFMSSLITFVMNKAPILFTAICFIMLIEFAIKAYQSHDKKVNAAMERKYKKADQVRDEVVAELNDKKKLLDKILTGKF